jgi:hypothetical protein
MLCQWAEHRCLARWMQIIHHCVGAPSLCLVACDMGAPPEGATWWAGPVYSLAFSFF